jgi:diaminopimelate decarboxylase
MRLLRACGIRGIDSVSVEECEMAIRAGYEPADIIYTANNASN